MERGVPENGTPLFLKAKFGKNFFEKYVTDHGCMHGKQADIMKVEKKPHIPIQFKSY